MRFTLQLASVLILATFEGTALSSTERVAFLRDIEIQVRFLIALPLMILAVLAFMGGFGFFAARFLTLPVSEETAHTVPLLASGAMLAGVIVALLVPLPFLMKRPTREDLAASQGMH